MRRRALNLPGLQIPSFPPLRQVTHEERLKTDNAHQRAYSRTIKIYCDFSSILIINSTIDV